MMGLLNWKAKYLEPGVCDGTQRSVEISTLIVELLESMATICFRRIGRCFVGWLAE